MNDSAPSVPGRITRLLGSAAELARAGTVESAVAGALEIARTALDQPLVGIYEHDPATGSVSVVDASGDLKEDDVPDRLTESIVERLDEREERTSAGSLPEASMTTDTEGPLATEVLVPAGRRWVLRLGATTPDGLDETDVAAAEKLAGLLGTALTRIEGRQRATTAEVTRSLFEQSTEATFISDADGTVVAVNDAAAALAGRDPAALSGTALTDVIVEDTSPSAPDDAVATGDRDFGTLQRPEGTAVTVELEHSQVAVSGTTYVRTTARERDTTPASRDEQRGTDAARTDAETLRRLYGLTVGSDDFDETVERLLSLGREHFGLDTGILAHIEGTDYEVEAVVDSTGTYEPGATFDLGETLCQVTLESSESTPLAFTDVADTEHREHPAASSIGAYIAAPVVVNGETYGTVNFSMRDPRDASFRPGEREFVELVATWVGVEIERRRRIEELERYETILEAVDDPVYALDAEGNFTFVNEAARREFGYGTELIGESPSIGMEATAVSRVREGIEELLATDGRSMASEFDIETADGTRRTVENRLALIGDDEFRGTAGVVRDITEREEQRRKLERFQRAVEEAADGIAVLDGDEYTYVDQSHVDMYGFESKEQLLGSTWRELYDDAEVERLEAEAFPALESEGYWRGMVTGSRPDGSTFPAELSLTIVEDGRLVCTVRDETERKERERELELREQAMNEASVGIQITGPTQEDNPLVYVNDGFERMTGYSREAVLGRNPRFLQGQDTDPERTAKLRAAIEEDEPVSVELRNYRKDGTPYWARLSVTPVTDESGAVQNYIGIQQDVTERRERNQWLQQFLSRGPLMFVETRKDDGAAVVESCSDRFLERLGYDRDEVVGEPLASFYTAESAADLQEGGYEDALAGGFELAERAFLDADGEPVHMLLRAVPRQDQTTGTSALFVDISDRKERERRVEARNDFLRRIYEVTTEPELSFEEKITGLLEAGREHLDLPYGFLTRIESNDDGESGTQRIVEALGSHERIQPGESTPLERSYCQTTIAQDDVTTLRGGAESGWPEDPAYETFGLETYIGGEVIAGDDLYGTLCFAGTETRDRPFTEFEQSFIRLAGRWAGYEIDRQDTRTEIEEQQEKLELTLSGTNTGIVEWDLRTDAVVWDETLVEMTGRHVEDIEALEEAVHPDDRDRVRERLETMLETGEPWVGEFRLLDGEGDTCWIGVRAVPSFEDETPVEVVATVTDITDRKAEEQRRKRNERRFQSLLEDPDMLVGLLDVDGTLLEANETGLAYISETGEEVIGAPLWETPWWAHSEELQRDLQGWIQRAADGEYVDYKATHPGPDGAPRIAEGTIRPVPGKSGSVESLVISARDVTDREQQRRELQDRQRKLGLVTSNTGTSIAELDLERGILSWDGMMGDNDIGSPETIEAFLDAVHQADRERLQSDLEALSRTREPLNEEYRLLNEDGDVMWISARAVPVGQDHGAGSSASRVVAIATDITQLKQRERALEESRERYETLLQAAPDPVFVADAETGSIVEMNTAAEDVLGRSRDEVIGCDQTELHPQGDAELYQAAFKESMGGARMISELQDGSQPKLRNVDGDPIPVEINADTVTLPQGPVVYGVFRDISERRERERELELKERAMDEANVGITISDPNQDDNPLVYVNDGFVQQTGYGRADAVGQNWQSLLAGQRNEVALQGLQDAIGTEEATTVELCNTQAGGEQLWSRFSVTPVRDEAGELANYIGIQQDVTGEKAREQRLRALHGTTQDLLRARDTDDAVAVTVETLVAEFNYDQAACYLREGDELVRAAESGRSTARPPDRIGHGQTPLWEAIEAGESVHYDDCGAIEDAVDRGDVVTSTYVPVGDHGAVVVGATDHGHIGESERRLVEVLTGNLAAVLNNFQREASLRASKRRYQSLTENIPNGGVLTFDADLEYRLAAGEFLSSIGLEPSSFIGKKVGTVLPEADFDDELVSRFRAALDGERTDRRIEIGDRTVRIHIVPIKSNDDASADARGLMLTQDVTEEARREQTLSEERERFRLLTESVDEYAFLVVGRDGTVQTWNESAETLFGYDAETAVGLPMADLHPEDEQESGLPDRLLQQARVAGESAQEGWRVRADGSEFYADVRYAPLESDDGTFRGYAMIVRDMTDRRRQQRRTETFVEESDDVVTIVDTDGSITYASGSAERVFGYDSDDLVGDNLFDYLHPEGREDAMETFFTGMNDPDANLEAECRFEAADGEWRNVEGQCRNMLDDDAIGGMLLYLRDVTERKSQARRFESIFNQTFQFTGLLEPDGTVVEANDATVEFAGIQRDELIGEPLSEAPWWAHSEAEAERARSAIERAAAGEFVRYETEARGADGLSTIDLSLKPVTDDTGAVTLLVAEGRDITRLQQHRRHLGVMQRVMRHNMRNDLMKMHGWTEAMCEESDAERRAEHFEIIEGILDKWTSMTRKMKEIRDVMESQSEEQRSLKPITASLEEAVNASRAAYPEATIDIDAACDDDVSIPPSLADAVSELIENAAEACDTSTIVVESSRPESDWLEVTVRDDGPGMPEMEADVLETGEESPLNHGQGLGLWMVRMIVRQAGGTVAVETGDDGTAVTLRLPAEPVDSAGRSGTIAR